MPSVALTLESRQMSCILESSHKSFVPLCDRCKEELMLASKTHPQLWGKPLQIQDCQALLPILSLWQRCFHSVLFLLLSRQSCRLCLGNLASVLLGTAKEVGVLTQWMLQFQLIE